LAAGSQTNTVRERHTNTQGSHGAVARGIWDHSLVLLLMCRVNAHSEPTLPTVFWLYHLSNYLPLAADFSGGRYYYLDCLIMSLQHHMKTYLFYH